MVRTLFQLSRLEFCDICRGGFAEGSQHPCVRLPCILKEACRRLELPEGNECSGFYLRRGVTLGYAAGFLLGKFKPSFLPVQFGKRESCQKNALAGGVIIH